MDKQCKTCMIVKPLNQFVKSKSVKSGYRSVCKACFNAYYRKRRVDKWDIVRGYERKFHTKRRLKHEYGITEEYYNLLQQQQSGKCKICFSVEKLVIDHCHTTLKVRGLLCNSCNMALGLFKDSINTLNSAKEYLQKHG